MSLGVHGQLPADGSWSRQLALDWGTDERAPLSPAPVVVAHVGVAEEFAQDEPGVGAALADAAVRDRLRIRNDSRTVVNGPQLGNGFERLVMGDSGGPRDVHRAGNVAATLGARLGQ